MRDSKDFVVNSTTESAEFSNTSNYSDGAFWEKVKRFAKKAGAKVIYLVLLLYYALKSPKTPKWAKTVIISALAYFICPIDLILNTIPIVGFTDDLAALAAALKAVQVSITPEVTADAKAKLGDWFGEVDDVELA